MSESGLNRGLVSLVDPAHTVHLKHLFVTVHGCKVVQFMLRNLHHDDGRFKDALALEGGCSNIQSQKSSGCLNSPITVCLSLFGLQGTHNRRDHPKNHDPDKRSCEVVENHFNTEHIGRSIENSNSDVEGSVEE